MYRTQPSYNKGCFMKSLLLLSVFVFSSFAIGHSGGTDANGCHNDHKRGGYHCHKADENMPVTPSTRTPASADKEFVQVKENSVNEKKVK